MTMMPPPVTGVSGGPGGPPSITGLTHPTGIGPPPSSPPPLSPELQEDLDNLTERAEAIDEIVTDATTVVAQITTLQANAPPVTVKKAYKEYTHQLHELEEHYDRLQARYDKKVDHFDDKAGDFVSDGGPSADVPTIDPFPTLPGSGMLGLC